MSPWHLTSMVSAVCSTQVSPWHLASMVSAVRSSQGQLPSGDSGVSKKTLHTCAFFINFLGYTVSLLTNVLSQNGYLLEATCGCCVGEISVG